MGAWAEARVQPSNALTLSGAMARFYIVADCIGRGQSEDKLCKDFIICCGQSVGNIRYVGVWWHLVSSGVLIRCYTRYM